MGANNVPAARIRAGLPLLAPGVQAFVMAIADESHDIDTKADWQEADVIAARRNAAHGPPT